MIEHSEELNQWKKSIRENLQKYGIDVGDNPVIEPPAKRSRLGIAFDQDNASGTGLIKRKPKTLLERKGMLGKKFKPSPHQALTKETLEPDAKPTARSVKGNNLSPLIRNSDGTVKVPDDWKSRKGFHSPEDRRTIIGTSNKLRRAMESLKKSDKKLHSKLIASHHDNIQLLLRCL